MPPDDRDGPERPPDAAEPLEAVDLSAACEAARPLFALAEAGGAVDLGAFDAALEAARPAVQDDVRRATLRAARDAIDNAKDAPSKLAALERARALMPPAAPTFAALCREIAERPTPVLLKTGFKTLDAACRGGIPAGSKIVSVGAPGAGKTALAVQWAHDWTIAGARVVYLAMDQQPEKIAVRLGQREGLAREDLEGATGETAKRAAWTTLADRLAPVVLDGATTTLETALEILRAMPGDGPLVLVPDSLQTIRCTAAEAAETPRARVDTILEVLRRARDVLVVGVSEMNRGGYIAGRASPTETLAAAKESGGLEFWADLLIGLRSVKDENDLVDVDVAKNRLGAKCELRLQQSFARALLTEIAMPADDDAAPGGRRGGGDLERRILDATRTQDLRSASAIYDTIKGNRPAVLAKVKAMRGDGRLVDVGGRLRPSDARTNAPAGDDDARSTSTSTSTSVGTSTQYQPPEGGGTGTGRDDVTAGGAEGAIRAALAHGAVPSFDAARLKVVQALPAWALRGAWDTMRADGRVVNQGTGKAPAWCLAASPEVPP